MCKFIGQHIEQKIGFAWFDMESQHIRIGGIYIVYLNK